MTDRLFDTRAWAVVGAGAGIGAIVVVVASAWAFNAPADDVDDAVAAVALGIAGAGIGLGTVTLRLGIARRAVRLRMAALLQQYLPDVVEAAAPTEAPASVAPLALVTRQLEEFGGAPARPVRRGRARRVVGSSA